MMKIGVDLSFIETQHGVEGIGMYTLNLLKGLQKINKLEHFCLFVKSSFVEEAKSIFSQGEVIELETPNIERLALEVLSKKPIKRLANEFYYYWKILPAKVQEAKCDMLFYPFNTVCLRVIPGIPVVITIHDLFFKNFPSHLRPTYLKVVANRYNYFMHKADALIAISNFVKEDILKFFNEVEASKIHVIHNPVILSDGKSVQPLIDGQYILSLNSIARHKNIITLVKAFHSVIHQIPHKLVLAGGMKNRNDSIKEYIITNNLEERVILTGYVDEDKKRSLYKNADLFVSPSLHEGFGLTPIEAMIMEIPVITTKETSLPEVTRGLANYYEPPCDHKKLAEKIVDILSNPTEKDDLTKVKESMLHKYCPETAALNYWDAFEKIYHGYGG